MPMESGYGLHITFGVWAIGVTALGGHVVWRLPVLLLIGAILFVEVVGYFALRWAVKFVEALLSTRLFRRQRLERMMQAAGSFQEWSRWAAELDLYEGREEWKARAPDRSYHPDALRRAVASIRGAVAAGDALALLEHLRVCLSRNFGGYMNPEVYTQTNVGTKHLITEFVEEVSQALDWLSERVGRGELSDKLTEYAEFVHDVGVAFGSTCLFLSGGAHFGFYHFGILRALLAEGQLPNLACGTSMGSLCAAFLATRSDEEALAELQSLKELYYRVGPEGGPMQGSRLQRLRNILTKGYMFECEEMLQKLEWFTRGDTTFAEAFEKTGRVVSITCTPAKTAAVTRMPPLLLNYITAPNVTIRSAVMASSCVPFLFPLVTLQEKVGGALRPWRGIATEPEEEEGQQASRASPRGRFRTARGALGASNLQEVQMRDGSFESDVPIPAMKALFNTQFSIVSQVNPHLVPFFFNPQGAGGRPIRWPWRNYRGGFLVYLVELWLKEDMIKNLLILQKTGLLFNVFGVDWSYLFTQQDHGEITLVPHATLADYWNVLENVLSRQDLVRKVRLSERNVWRNFTQIQARMRLQRSLRRLGESVLAASEAASPSAREAVLRRCGPVHAAAFRVRGRAPAEPSVPRRPTADYLE